MVILNHAFLKLLVNEMKLKKEMPKEFIVLVVVVVWVMPVQLCDTNSVPLGA